MILRRSIILALGSMPLLARAGVSQTAVKVHRVGLLSSGAPVADTSEIVVGLTAGFSKRGYTVGSSLLFERRGAEVHPDRLPGLVDDLKNKVELIISLSYAAARVVKDRSKVPAVVIAGADPVAAELSAKRLEVLKETFPHLRKIAMLWNADDLGMTLRYRSAEAAARNQGFEIQPLGVREPEDFTGAFAPMLQDRPDASNSHF